MITGPVEFWKPWSGALFIEGSSLGRIRTLDRYVKQGNREQFIKGQILKLKHRKDDYLQVGFNKDGKYNNKLVHRIIAECFIPNPNELSEVNHKDCNRANNCISNLEFCTRGYNQKYKNEYGTSMAEVLGRPVYAVNLKTYEVLRFRSRREAAYKLKVHKQNITSVIKGREKTSGGFWFTEDDGNGIEIDRNKLNKITTGRTSKRSVVAVNLEMLRVFRFESQHEAGRVLGIEQGSIYSVLKGRYKQTHNFWFTYADNDAVENVRTKFGNNMAYEVEKLMNEKMN